MWRYLMRRLVQLPVLLFIVTLMTFGLMHMAPGGPEQIFLAGEKPGIKREEIQEIRKKWGLDQPFHVQYWKWISRVVQGDLGRSFASQRPVMEAFWERIPATLELNIVVLVCIYLIAIPLGVITAVRQYSWVDYVATTCCFLLDAMPGFWVGLMLIVFVALPSGGAVPTNGFPDVHIATEGWYTVITEHARYMLLPVITVVLTGLAALTRYMRGSMLEVLREDYVRTARAKGLSEQIVVYKHSLRNALLPIITLSSDLISGLFGGLAIIESVFAWPGVGLLGIKAVSQHDHPVVLAFLLFYFLLQTISSFLTEFVYVTVDPRIKYS